MSYTAKKYIPGLGKEFFISPDHIEVKGTADKYIPGLGSQFKIGADSIDDKGGAEKYIPGLGTQFSVGASQIEGAIVLRAEEGASGKTVGVTVTTVGGVQPIVLKYASGVQSESYFKENGTIITKNTFTVTVKDKYTIYAEDKNLTTALKVIEVKGVTD